MCNSGLSAGVHDVDKPAIAVGPRSDGVPGDAVYLFYRARADGCSNYSLFSKVSVAAPASVYPGFIWPQDTSTTRSSTPISLTDLSQTTCGENGSGISMVVLPSGQHRARVVAAYTDNDIGDYVPPSVIYSDIAGATSGTVWHPSAGPGPLGGAQLNFDSGNNEIYAIVPSQIPGNLFIRNFPSVAVDPNNGDLVYVVFTGRPSTSLPYNDLYIAESMNGGNDFPQDAPGVGKVTHLTNTMLGDPANSFKLNPAIVVDKFGGLNLVYYRLTPNPTDAPNPSIEVRYARIKNLGQGASQSIVTLTLTPSPTPASRFPGGLIGEYLSIATSGCSVWPSFPSGHEPWPFTCDTCQPVYTINYYIRRISLPECFTVADFNQSGQIEPTDIVAFGTAYSQGQPSADLNADAALTPLDWQTFVNAYTCGCNP